MLKRYDVTTYVNKMHFLFVAHLVRTSKLSVLDWSNLRMGDLSGNFSGSVRERTKHAGKTRVGL